MIATIVAPRTMPSLAADSDISTFRHPHSPYSLPARSSADKPRPAGEHAEKLSNGDASVVTVTGNKLSNGPAVQPAPNGRPVQPAAADKPLPSVQASTTSPRDDGYFASVHTSEMQDGCRTTHVKLGTRTSADSTKDARKDFNPPTKYELDQQHPQTPQAALQVPNSSYRVSSPPAFNHISNPPEQPYRLQHRHTLEVPKVSTARAREIQNSTDDVVTASGRFSPNTPTRRRGSMSLARRATRSIHSDMHLEEVPQDEDAARWAEHIRQKRASKRKRKDDEDDDRVVVGTKVDQNHVNWVTAYNMLTGIRFTVSRTNAKMDRELTDADFEAKHKFSFDMYVLDNFSLANLLLLFDLPCALPQLSPHQNANIVTAPETNSPLPPNTISSSRTTRPGFSAISVPSSS